MAENSAISWTTHTANFWWGCVKVSALCDHCYADDLDKRYHNTDNHFGQTAPRKFISSVWSELVKWNNQAKRTGTRPRVFVMSMGDFFESLPADHPDLMAMADARSRAIAFMEEVWTNLDFLVLTKRISNVAKFVPDHWLTGKWPANVRLGISVGTQKDADRDIPRLLELPCPNFLSMEPLLEGVELRPEWLPERSDGDTKQGKRCVCSSGSGRIDDRQRRQDMERGQSSRQSLDGDNGISALHSEASRTQRGEISANTGDDRRHTTSCSGSPLSISPLLRQDTGGIDRQSQERQDTGQSSLEPGIGDSLRAADTRHSHAQDLSPGASEWREEHSLQTHQWSGSGNSTTTRQRRETCPDCGGLRSFGQNDLQDSQRRQTVNWLICGGESGPQARPSHPEWFRSLRDQCVASGVPFHFKQWGEWSPFATQARYAAGSLMPGNAEIIGGDCGGRSQYGMPYQEKDGRKYANIAEYNQPPKMVEIRDEPTHRWGKENRQTMTYLRVGKKAAGRLLDGRTWDQFPKGEELP